MIALADAGVSRTGIPYKWEYYVNSFDADYAIEGGDLKYVTYVRKFAGVVNVLQVRVPDLFC